MGGIITWKIFVVGWVFCDTIQPSQHWSPKMAKPGYLNARIDEEIEQALWKYTKENDITVSQVVRAALREYFARKTEAVETKKESA